MKVQAPHWLTSSAATLGVACGGLAQAFPQYAAIFALIAGVCAFIAAPTLTSTPKSSVPDAATRGFTSMDALTVVVFLGCSALACGLFQAVAPAAQTLEQCEEQVALDHPALDFAQFVAQSIASCSAQGIATVIDVIEFVLHSADPNVTQYRDEAAAAKASPAKLGALRAQVGHK